MQKNAPRLLCLFLVTFFSMTTSAQVQFWVDDFEGTNSSGGTRTPENNGGVGGPPFTSYFCRTPANGTVSQSVPFTGFQGVNYWAGEDHDAAGTGFAGAGTFAESVRQQDITWTNINISGKTGLSFSGLIAANSTNQPWDNRNSCSGGATTNTDYIIVQYKIDAAATWTDILRFFSNGALTGKYLFQENTGDSCGDGTQLLNTFQNFNANITGTGTTLQLRLLVYSEGGNEEWGVDNFRLSSTGVVPVTWTSFNARKNDKTIALDWSTASEQNTKDFTVQYSNENNSWTDLGKMPAQGVSHKYSYVHLSPINGNNVYRIRQTDLDGKVTYSDTRSVSFSSSAAFSIITNPVENNVLQINAAKQLTVSVYTAEGKMVLTKNLNTGITNIPLTKYGKGVFIVKGEKLSYRIVVK